MKAFHKSENTMRKYARADFQVRRITMASYSVTSSMFLGKGWREEDASAIYFLRWKLTESLTPVNAVRVWFVYRSQKADSKSRRLASFVGESNRMLI